MMNELKELWLEFKEWQPRKKWWFFLVVIPVALIAIFQVGVEILADALGGLAYWIERQLNRFEAWWRAKWTTNKPTQK